VKMPSFYFIKKITESIQICIASDLYSSRFVALPDM